jgi:5-hydroxyisourate hydrolase
VSLHELRDGGEWRVVAETTTNADGRSPLPLMPAERFVPGTYRMHFDTDAYFRAHSLDGFYPYADIVFVVRDVTQHYHVPLLLSPFGYSTYRGS